MSRVCAWRCLPAVPHLKLLPRVVKAAQADKLLHASGAAARRMQEGSVSQIAIDATEQYCLHGMTVRLAATVSPSNGGIR